MVGRPAAGRRRACAASRARPALAAAEAAARTAVAAGWDGEVRGLLAVADTVKPTSAEAVAQLRALGLRPVLLTGDNLAPAEAVAAEVGIDRRCSPRCCRPTRSTSSRACRPRARSSRWSATGSTTPPALAQADLGLAMGTGTDVAIEASDLTLVRGDLRAAADAIRLSRRTLGTIKGNLFWAFAYNVAAIPLAMAAS